MTTSQKNTYADSGVDIEAGNALVESIKPLVKSTKRPGADVDIGGFGGLFDLKSSGYKDPILVSATDGVGTKLKVANILGQHDTVGIDLVAMCVNDLVVQGAEPLFFLDYFATGKLENAIAKDVIKGIAEGCKQAGCALVGGETAEMPGMYQHGDYDLAGFSVGAVERDRILPTSDIRNGDVILGLPSSGVHSNGFSLVRHIIDSNNLDYNHRPNGWNKTLGEALLIPTSIYVKACLSMIETGAVKAFAHITGGGLTENIPRVLPDGLVAEVDCSNWELPQIFQWLAKTGNIEANEMLKTFNCGIGMVIVVSEQDAQKIADVSNDVKVIGTITEGSEITATYQNIEFLYD